MVSGVSLFVGLFNNLALLVILVAVYGFLYDRIRHVGGLRRSLILGLLFGLFAFGCMQVKIPVYRGVLVDQRNGIVIMAGVFGGPVSAAIAALIAGAYRAVLGGSGVPGGILGVALAAVAGSFLHYRREKVDGLWKLALWAVAATVFVLPGFIPVGTFAEGWALMIRMAVPYGSAISVGLVVGSFLLWNEERRCDAQQMLADSEREYRHLFESLVDVSYRTDAEGAIEIISPSAERMLGYRPDELRGKRIEAFYADPSRRREIVDEVKRNGYADGFESEFVRRDGTKIVISTNARIVTDGSGAFRGIEGVTRDITRAKLAEERVRATLAEREALISELYHRANNNMQIISSYLMLQAAGCPDEKVDRLVKGLSARIYAMSLVYDKLYRSHNLSRIDIRDYIEDLVLSIVNNSGRKEGEIRAEFDLAPVELILDAAIPLGLALNEIVGNSCAHAFPGGRTGTIRVSIKRRADGAVELVVSDDGVGLPSGLDPMTATSFGLYTTVGIIRLQMRGNIEIISGPGVTYRIALKDDLYEERVR